LYFLFVRCVTQCEYLALQYNRRRIPCLTSGKVTG